MRSDSAIISCICCSNLNGFCTTVDFFGSHHDSARLKASYNLVLCIVLAKLITGYFFFEFFRKLLLISTSRNPSLFCLHHQKTIVSVEALPIFVMGHPTSGYASWCMSCRLLRSRVADLLFSLYALSAFIRASPSHFPHIICIKMIGPAPQDS